MTSVRRRLAALISLVVCALFMIWKMRSKLNASETTTKHRLLGNVPPNIYTFYAPLVHARQTKREKKIHETDQRLLEAWQLAWREAGWNPVVLTLEDAQRHVLYNITMQQLDKSTLLGKGGRNEEYNRYCFLRYVAMAAVGGGVMADYDLFPLHATNTPRKPIGEDSGYFTVYQKTLNKAGGVPSLCSGRATEWERMAKSIVQVAQGSTNVGWSDMLALMYLHKKLPQSHVLQDNVLGYKELTDNQAHMCQFVKSQNAWAVHFSHYDVQSTRHTVLDRPDLAASMARQYATQCSGITQGI